VCAVHDEHKMVEFLRLEGGSRLRWDTILRKRARYRECWRSRSEKVARYDKRTVRELLTRPPKIIRTALKIELDNRNAEHILEVQERLRHL